MPTAFVSYAHENEIHQTRAIALADQLCREGVDASIDAYDPHPSEGWPKWMEKQFKLDFIIVILSDGYIREFNQEVDSASGARYEGVLLSSKLAQTGVIFKNIALVCFGEGPKREIPLVLGGCTRYYIDRSEDYKKLYSFLTAQALHAKPLLGEIINFPKATSSSHAFGDRTFSSICKLIWPYMEDNRRIFQDFGPNSGIDNSGSTTKIVRFDLSLWYGKRTTIVDNNNIIADHIRSNISLIPDVHVQYFEKWLSHIDAFALHVSNDTIDYHKHQFPKEVISIVREGAFEASNH